MTTATPAMDFMLCEEPLHVAIMVGAAKTTGRLARAERWTWRIKHTRLSDVIRSLQILGLRQYRITKRFNFTKSFRVTFHKSNVWVWGRREKCVPVPKCPILNGQCLAAACYLRCRWVGVSLSSLEPQLQLHECLQAQVEQRGIARSF